MDQYRRNLDRMDVYLDGKGGRQPYDQVANLCGSVQRLSMVENQTAFYIGCRRPLNARYVYIVAQGQPLRSARLFSAILCEVIVHG